MGNSGGHVGVGGGVRALGHHAPLTLQTFHSMEKGTAEDSRCRAHKTWSLAEAFLNESKCTKMLHNWSTASLTASFLCRKEGHEKGQMIKNGQERRVKRMFLEGTGRER